MKEQFAVLLVDDDPHDRELIARALRKSFPLAEIDEAANQAQLDVALLGLRFDIVVTDYHLNWTNGIEVLRAIKDAAPDCPVIMYTGTGSEEIAVQAMKLGLDDYIIKSVRHLVRLQGSVKAALEHYATRKRAETLSDQLNAALNRTRLLFDQSADGICTMTFEDGVLEANSAFATMIGATNIASIVGMQPWHWDDVYSSPERFQQRWPAPPTKSETFETRFRRPDGSKLDVEITATPTVQNNQMLLFYVCRDITARKRVTEALERSQRHLEAAQSQAEIGSWECGADGVPSVWSSEMFKLFERSPIVGIPTFKEILQAIIPADRQRCQSASCPEDRGAFFQERLLHARQANPDADGFQYAYRVYSSTGERHLEETVRVAETDSDGQSMRWMGTTLDVTQRVASNLALRNSRERFLRALNNIPDVVVIYDSDLRIQFINAATTKVTERPTAFYLGKRDEELWPPEICDAYVPTLKEALTTKTKTFVEFHVDLPEAGHRHLMVQCLPILGSDGEVREVVGITRDLTQLSDLQQQFLHAQRMECVGRLAGGVAHDFNNMLSVILNSVAIARHREPQQQFPADEMLMIEQAVERAALLTRQLLTFSRQETVSSVPLTIDEVISNVYAMLCRVLGERVELRLSLGAPEINVLADPGQMEQVLMNLVVNARDAMPDGGLLTIITTYDAEHQAVRLRIEDTGIGMEQKTQQRIFEPFFTTKEVGKGTGLGLSTVYGITQQFGGTISVNSAPGEGTTFTIELPETSRPAEQCGEIQSSDRVKGNETILVVEDDEVLLKTVRALLESSDYRVLTAGNGADAMEVLRSSPDHIDLVFTDAVMPGQSGWQLAQFLSAYHPDIKVLCTSGYMDEELRKQQARFDASHFLQKPYSMTTLTARIRSLLDESSTESL